MFVEAVARAAYLAVPQTRTIPLFLDRLLGRHRKQDILPTTGGRRVYAVGDVHGRLDALQPLIRAIADDLEAAPPPEPALLVFLGDYVDRGPESKGVVDLVLKMRATAGLETRALKGNHEEALLQFLAEPSFGATWMEHGGGPTLVSYGVQPPPTRTDNDAWARARDELERVLPAEHRAFYENLELMLDVGDYAFVHAGVRPGIAWDQQAERDLLWIRQEFLQEKGPFGKVIVHGHTPMEEAQLTRHRLGIDTGCYATGVLTAVRLQDADQRLIQVKAERRFG
ncbi:metallophosphoesterase family protein [Phenylobacterium sp.]|uniref:metallophosphoesterase family protein n=1 Tax=Phenylobacterium sp. TaxID=1871053 RepID=UPI002D1D7266|nr:metallophosphoesterase family protein [Phenylobacterium sp.]HVI31590.1 metallophosphoesterase family protein [Phenylobacterium sp.]